MKRMRKTMSHLAGGLCLALKGVPVKPTDDVDVDKTYELIAVEELEKL